MASSGGVAPFQFTRQCTQERMHLLDEQISSQCGLANSNKQELQYALRVRVEAKDDTPIPRHLWMPTMIDKILQEAGAPTAGNIITIGPGDFWWYSQARGSEQGLSEAVAEGLFQHLTWLQHWFRADLSICIAANPAPLHVANGAARDVRSNAGRLTPTLSCKEQRQERQQERKECHWACQTSPPNEGGRPPMGQPPVGAGSKGPPSDDDDSDDEDKSSIASSISSVSTTTTRSSQSSSWCGRHGFDHLLKLTGFNGKTGEKSDQLYDQWCFNVRMLQAGCYNLHALRYKVIWSLTGTSGHRVRDLGMEASVNDMISWLDQIYGTVLTYDGLMKHLYGITQWQRETITDYDSCLAQAFAMLQQEFLQWYDTEAVDDKRCECFFEGLCTEICNAIQFLVKQELSAPYHRLLHAAQESELETQEASKPVPLTAMLRNSF